MYFDYEPPPFQIDKKESGPWMTLRCVWNDETARAAAEAGIVGLSVGPENSDLSFLKDLSHLQGFSYLHDGADIGPIHHLVNLRWLGMFNMRGPKVDFTRFPNLEECNLDPWSPTVSRVFEAHWLRRLCLDRLPNKHFSGIANLAWLRRLTIFSGSIETLEPIGGLTHLEYLRIARMRKLRDASAIARLTNLHELKVQDCWGFSTLNHLSSLTRLEELTLDGVGPVDTLTPLATLVNLTRFWLYGIRNTHLVDRGVSVLERLPNLERYWVKVHRATLTGPNRE
ncbi:hypothetical protein [Fimbriimonas ginsengisoli]|uniref:Leucine-rich repeat domain-containing protein n=1 Tax=Fimbriimonas ginsengisoli Gsoil 348 TaxID=661478 RepID=A0A068NNM9_FIMGI|nr:hypothetical protein [Fimbriimonas ginsengisoli]AIE84365.1 hypothetical protein OP10G_0997 [Fimbriimonas ginsengisoli Gsoil 348]